jgi:diguanylate cyclase (GGDEF)-like protein/PAS domain S-box-containing protein
VIVDGNSDAGVLASRPNARTFLVVDDYPAHAELLLLQLQAAGHAALTAGNGIEALQVLERERVDGIVSDVLMPQMDGYKLCIEVRKSRRFGGVPIVFYSATHNSAEDRTLADAAGADAFIEKPAPIEAILAGLGQPSGKHRPAAAHAAIPELDAPILKQYNESLVRKLEEKSAELAQTEARLSGMVEAAMDAIISVDDRHDIVLFNSAAEKMFGCPRAEVLARALTTLIPQRPHDPQAAALELFADWDTAAGPLGLRTVWGLRGNGTEFPIEASISSLNTSRGRLYTLFLRDITDRYRAEQDLARSAAALRQAQQLAKLAHVITEPRGGLEDSAGSLAQFMGVAPSQVPRTVRGWLKLVHPEDRHSLCERAISARRTATRTEAAYRMRRGGVWIHIHHVMDPLPAARDRSPHALSWFHTLQDISDWKQATLRIQRLNQVLTVLSAINALIARTNDRGELLRETCRIVVEAGQFPQAWIGLVEGAAKELRFAAGYGGTEAFYQSLRADLSDDTLRQSSLAAIALRDQKPVVINDLQRDGRALTNALDAGSRALAMLPLIIEGSGVGVLAIHAEVAGFFDDEEMKSLRELAGDISFALDHLSKSEQIRYLASYDPVTGLPNRVLFSERLSQAMQQPMEDDVILAVALLDLERFRRVNETLGRAVGDEVLRLVARRLQQANGTAARIGVDVFALMIRDKHSVSEVARDLEHVVARCCDEPFNLGGEELRLGCRGGIAVFPNDGANAETLLRNAEAALRRAKTRSEHSVFYAPELNARAAEGLTMESRLRRAIERKEFVLYYQPIFTLSDRRMCGLEALLRWHNAEDGLVLPGRFIPVLEESGLIGEVGEWVMRQSLLDQKRWRDAGCSPPRVAVNVSAMQLRRQDFADVIGGIVAANEGSQLELEITESMIMEQVDRNIEALKQIRALGVNIAIDDFGTGYCSLSYVAKLPVNSLKIDRTFIVAMTEGTVGMAVVSSIIALAHSLGLKVVAEGVETAQQERLLHRLSCDEAQGYLFSRPVPYDEIGQLLRAGGVFSAGERLD